MAILGGFSSIFRRSQVPVTLTGQDRADYPEFEQDRGWLSHGELQIWTNLWVFLCSSMLDVG